MYLQRTLEGSEQLLAHFSVNKWSNALQHRFVYYSNLLHIR